MNNIIIYILIIVIIGIILYILKDKILEEINEKFLWSNFKQLPENNMINTPVISDPTLTDMVHKAKQDYVNQHQNRSLNRYLNPVTFPYKSLDDYEPMNFGLPPHVIGCASRNQPCSLGTQIPVIATSPMLNITNHNISHTGGLPINISSRGPEGLPQQVGTIYKMNSVNNEVLPLFGRKKYPRGSYNWEYYTMAGDFGVKLNIIARKKGEQLGTNDIVFIKGYSKSPYRVTMYDYDYPQYIPY